MSGTYIKPTHTISSGTALLAMTLLAMLLSSCGGLEDELGGVGGGTISINADSGNQRSLEGTWSGCYYESGLGDFYVEYIVANDTLKQIFTEYPSTDSSCTGTVVDSTQVSGTMATSREVTTSGWHNGGSVTAAPGNQAGTGSLADPPITTGLIITDDATLVETLHFFYMDDSAGTWCIYSALNPAYGTDADGFPSYVFTGLVACKV